MIRLSLVLIAAAIAGTTGCGNHRTHQSPFGAIAISAALSASEVATVEVTVSGAGIDPALTTTLAKSGSEWTGTIAGVPAGSARTVHASARGVGGVLIYQGSSAGITVNPGATAAVVIVMQQVTPPPPNDDNAPVIDGVVASNLTPAAGETITLDVTAHDVDAGAVLSYQWAATGGTFNPVAADGAHVEWTVPDPNTETTYAISVTVTDEKALTATLTFEIGAFISAGSLQLNVTANTWPVVSAMTATPVSVAPGTAIAFTATTSDADGDAATVTWSADCAGDFSAATGTSTSFTPSTTPFGNLCTVTATATDGKGGTGTGSRGVWVGLGAPPVTQACTWTQVYFADLATAPPEAVAYNGAAGGQGGEAMYGRTCWLMTSDWAWLVFPVIFGSEDDVFAVEADVFVPTPGFTTYRKAAGIFAFNTASPGFGFGTHGIASMLGFNSGAATTLDWWADPTPAGSWNRSTTISYGFDSWRRMRVEGRRSSCSFRAYLDGALTDSWTGACDTTGVNISLAGGLNTCWSNLAFYRGGGACPP